MGKKEFYLISTLLTIFLVTFDQIIKILIDKLLYQGEEINLLPFFNITKVYNQGAGLSILEGKTWIILIISIIILSLIVKQLNESLNQKNIFLIISLVLIVSGGIGNIIDRIVYQHVIDYIEIILGNYIFPIFNFADILITLGATGIFIHLIKGEK